MNANARAVSGLILAWALGGAGTVSAVTNTWTVRANANWNAAANWSGGVPSASDDCVMAAPAGTAIVVSITNAVSVNSLTFDHANANHSLAVDNGGSLTVPANSVIGHTALYSGVFRVYQTNAALAAGALVGATNLTVQACQVHALGGKTAYWTISNGLYVLIDGAAMQIGSANNSKGQLTVGSGGTLRSTQGVSLSSGDNAQSTLVVDGGLLLVRNSSSPAIRRTGGAPASVLFNSGTIENIGGSGSTFASLTLTNILEIALGDAGQRIFNTGAMPITVSNNCQLVDQPGKAGSLTKIGSSRLVLQGANTHSGETAIREGDVRLEHTNALVNSTLNVGTAGGLKFLNGLTGATLGGLAGTGSVFLVNTDSAPVTLTVGGNGRATEFSGPLTGSGALTKVGTGALTLSGTNTYSGATTVSNGALLVGGRLSNSAVSVAAGASFGAAGAVSTSVEALALSEGAAVAWTVDSVAKTAGHVSVDGTLTLPAAATLSAAGAAELDRTLVLFSAGALAGATDLSGWTLTGLPGGSTLVVKDKHVLLRVPRGSLLMAL